MNGVHPPNHNRFELLGSTIGKSKGNRIKRLRSGDFSPLPLPTQCDQYRPRYIVASTRPTKEDEEVLPLASYNVFQVERGLNYISTCRLEVNEMRSGDLLIKVPDNKTAEKFLKTSFLDNIPVKFALHKTLNTTQGRIFSRKIIKIAEEELLSSLKDQKVVEVRKITKNDGNGIIATGAAIITFDLFHLPEYLKLGWERVSVEEYIPNPMKCANCQKLGHTKNRCKNIELCKECGFPKPHEACSRTFCVNCQTEEHTSYDPDCPTFWKHKSVNYLRITRRCSTTREAWKFFNDNPSLNTLKPSTKKGKNITTYAQILSKEHNKPVNSMSLQKTITNLNNKQNTSSEKLSLTVNEQKEKNSLPFNSSSLLTTTTYQDVNQNTSSEKLSFTVKQQKEKNSLSVNTSTQINNNFNTSKVTTTTTTNNICNTQNANTEKESSFDSLNYNSNDF